MGTEGAVWAGCEGCLVGRREEVDRLRRLLMWPSGQGAARFAQVAGRAGDR